MIGLRAELALLLEPGDPRWMSFGLQRPAAGRIPEPVEDLVLTPLAPDTVLVQWNRSTRADGYRVTWQVENGVADSAKTILTSDAGTHLTELPPGETIVVSVSARNRSGETKGTQQSVSLLAPRDGG